MSEYIPYIPEVEDGFRKPDPTTQLLLQSTYGWIMHRIKDALDKYVHHGAEQSIEEFNYAAKYDEEPKTHDLVQDYLADLMSSCWAEEKAEDIAGELGSDALSDDIEKAITHILQASYERLDQAITNSGATRTPFSFDKD